MTLSVETLFDDLVREKQCPYCGTSMIQRKKRGGWTCKPCAAIRSAAWRVDNPDKTFDVRLWTYYRIRLSDYQRMLEEQNYCCAACGKPAAECNGSRAWSRLVVDHDHSCCDSTPLCGKCVRALICSGCNVALGHIGDSVERLERLIAYLKNFNQPT